MEKYPSRVLHFGGKTVKHMRSVSNRAPIQKNGPWNFKYHKRGRKICPNCMPISF